MNRIAFGITIAAIAGLSLEAAFAQNVRTSPTLPPTNIKTASCIPALTATPGAVSPTQTYQCESAPAACLSGWSPGNVHIVNAALVYNCVPTSQIPK